MYNPFAKHKDFFASPTFRAVLVTLAGVAGALLIFHAGMVVGYRKAWFAYRWSEAYSRNFSGPTRGWTFADRAFVDGHGASGRILEAGGDRLVILGNGPSEEEKVVLVSGATAVRRFEHAIPATELKPDDYVVVIGRPDEQGQINAKFIRVMPQPDGPGNVIYFHR